MIYHNNEVDITSNLLQTNYLFIIMEQSGLLFWLGLGYDI